VFNESGVPASDSRSEAPFSLAMSARGLSSPGDTTMASSPDQSSTLAVGLLSLGPRAFNPNADLPRQLSALAESSANAHREVQRGVLRFDGGKRAREATPVSDGSRTQSH
jgi:hypothetical protein